MSTPSSFSQGGPSTSFMASSSPATATTGTSLRRIRVKTTAAHLPLLPETRAWLQYDIHRHPTVAECRNAFLEQLGLRLDGNDADVRMTLDGFDLLETLSSETLDPVGAAMLQMQ